MADPVSGSIIAAELAPTVAATIPELAATTALSAPFAAAPALGITPEFAPLMMSGNSMVSAMGNGMATQLPTSGGMGGGSLFGFDTTGGGIGQGVMESLKGANSWMNQNPITTQLGMKTASSLMPQQQPVHYSQPGQISRGQIQPMDYMSLLNPQNQSVLRQQPISLL